MISIDRTTVCNDRGVEVADTTGRIATITDLDRAGSCELSRGSVEGPNFICTDTLNARKISEGLPGTPTTLALRVTDQTCSPVSGAIVVVWQCDARGNYSAIPSILIFRNEDGGVSAGNRTRRPAFCAACWRPISRGSSNSMRSIRGSITVARSILISRCTWATRPI